MVKRLYSALTILAVLGACVISLPQETVGAFTVGGADPDCNCTGRNLKTCGSIGSGTCKKKRQTCYAGKGKKTQLCQATMGGASPCDGTDFCEDTDHDATTTVCQEVGGGG